MSLRLKLQGTIGRAFLLGAMAFTAVSYGQIDHLSKIRDVGTTEQVLDLTISLHRQWDDMADDLKHQYEQTIGYWADGIYEMTNGGHKLGKIRIFTDSRFAASADVQWVDSTWPKATVNGFTSANSKIYMSDTFSFRFPTNRDSDWQGAGYTLAHESGHYIYALYDEYNLVTGDIPVVPSVMNSQWYAVGGGYEWLNFSTSNNIGDLSKTGQGRGRNTDAWSFLTRSSAVGYNYYPILNSRKPVAADTHTSYSWVRVELPSAHARDSLKIIWMGKTIDIDLILDRSGSMYGTPLANVKTAAKSFVDAVNIFSNNFQLIPSIGITTFSTAPSNTYSMAPLTDTNVGEIKDIIDAISDDGMTAMYDACTLSIDKLNSYSSDNSTRLSMLLTDGEENYSSSAVNDVLTKAVTSNIPIFTFGYGNSNSYYNNCRALSTGTNGRFYANLTHPDSVFNSWMNIFDDAADLQHVIDVAFSASDGLNFTIDPTVYAGVVSVNYTLQNANSFCNFTIEDGKGNQVPLAVDAISLGNSYPMNKIALISISNNAVAEATLGEWKLKTTSSGLNSTYLKGTVRIKGKSDGTYAIAIGNHQGGFYTWPVPLRLSTSITGKNGLITRLNVTATLTSPSGIVTNVVLNDDGINGDNIAHDGIYSLDYSNYTENGQYALSVQFNNGSGRAYYAMDGVEHSVSASGATFSKDDTTFVTDDFVRVKSIVFHIDGVNAQPPTRTGSIMGFESDTLWHIVYSSGTLASSTVRTQGKASLQIAGNGWQQIMSDDINTDELRNVTNNLSVDLYMGDTQTNPHWTGQVQLFINCPSANIYNQYIDLVELTGLPLDVFSTLSFTLPQGIVDVLNGSYSDFSFSLSINTNAFTGAYYFDNMRFGN